MPAISLVVCVHRQRDFLERLLRESAGCYDELIVEHDIPDEQNARSVVENVGGRFFARPASFLQEPHWPFLWAQAKFDWILRLDADEFPGHEMKNWLKDFRVASEPPAEVSGYSCIWPLWDGQRTLSQNWPAGHIFLFHKQRVRFFGMCEQGIVPDGDIRGVEIVLHHQPARKPYGLHNMIFRQQSRRGRAFIGSCLLGKPADLNCWRWETEAWPPEWEQIRAHPLRSAVSRLIRGTLRGLRDQWTHERKIFPIAAVCGPIFHCLMCLKYWQIRRQHFRKVGLHRKGK
jgi:hypothetical protein